MKDNRSETVTIVELNQYKDLVEECKELTLQINKCESKNVVCSDIVVGSMDEYPYSKRTFEIKGIQLQQDELCKQLKEKLSHKRIELLSHMADIENKIENIDNARVRRIIRLRYFEGLSWKAVARKVFGYPNESTARSVVLRYLNNYKHIE